MWGNVNLQHHAVKSVGRNRSEDNRLYRLYRFEELQERRASTATSVVS